MNIVPKISEMTERVIKYQIAYSWLEFRLFFILLSDIVTMTS
jgi:hypothetical protein